jgi:diguanylate cyclase (GGDEF)-like protein
VQVRSIYRDVFLTIVASGAIACVILLAWAGVDVWTDKNLANPTAGAFAMALFERVRGGVIAIAVCCAVASLGIVCTVRRFQIKISEFQAALSKLPSAARKGAEPAAQRATSSSSYVETQHLARTVDDVHHAFSEREHRFERSQLRLRDQLNQLTQEVQDASARAHQLAMVDPLTNLPNRMKLNEELERAITDAAALRCQASVLFIDIDHFKRLNDSLGHEVGDQVLQHVAITLRQHLRENDVAARLGGDEFVVVLRNLPADSAKAVVDRYLGNVYNALRNPIDLGGRSTLITLSIGASMFPGDATDSAALMRGADSAMYAAKQKGRNRADWYKKGSEADQSNISAREQALRNAIANRQLHVVFQPQVRADDGTPVGVEALVRWNHPTKGVIAPSQFIKLAEQSGLIVPLGQRVLELAFGHAKRWDARELNMRMAINLSVRQLEQQGWIESLHQMIDSFGLPPRLIDLEVTESVIADDPIAMEKTLKNLSARGFTLSLDDFGTGFSSLNYLARFPFNNVKIDRQFVTDIDAPASRNIVQSIIALGHTLNMRTIAEGVETPQQFKILKEMGCDEVQGFFVAEPMKPDDVLDWWEQRVETTSFLSQQDNVLGASNVQPISLGRSTSVRQPASGTST